MIDKDDTYVLNQRVARITLIGSDYLPDNYLLYLQLADSDTRSLLQSMAHGGVQVNLSTSSIKSTPILVPPRNVFTDEFRILKSYHEKTKANRKQILTLEKLRDTLLPKLMSGEVRVRQN
jgi:type I restriction enzyme S subunit